jgi:hypothetical protein
MAPLQLQSATLGQEQAVTICYSEAIVKQYRIILERCMLRKSPDGLSTKRQMPGYQNTQFDRIQGGVSFISNILMGNVTDRQRVDLVNNGVRESFRLFSA